MAKQDGGPAFPMPSVYSQHGDYEQGVTGMSLRDWLAGQAMQAALATGRAGSASDLPDLFATTARLSYEMADAMLVARAA